MPLKRAILPLLDRADPLAAEVGGANTVIFAEDGRIGYNTDVPGMITALAEAGISRAGRALVLGAGATACAALAALRESALRRSPWPSATRPRPPHWPARVWPREYQGLPECVTLTRRQVSAASAGPQAEDHLGRLPPGRLYRWRVSHQANLTGCLAVGRPAGWLIRPDARSRAQEAPDGRRCGCAGRRLPAGTGIRAWWPRRHGVRGFLPFGREAPRTFCDGMAPAQGTR
ncbi:MAG: hypothetical protein ACLQER_09360 [Streptosporangiaceae bacterium]